MIVVTCLHSDHMASLAFDVATLDAQYEEIMLRTIEIKNVFPFFYPRSSICSFADHYYILCHLFLFFFPLTSIASYLFSHFLADSRESFEIISTLTFEMLLNKISWRDNGKSASFSEVIFLTQNASFHISIALHVALFASLVYYLHINFQEAMEGIFLNMKKINIFN